MSYLSMNKTMQADICDMLLIINKLELNMRDHWYVSNVSIISDVPCLFYDNTYMVCLHFISYYGIYWTNLLTRCHSASFCLLCLFIAEKAQKPKCSEKSRKITEILFRRKTHGARRASQGEAQGLLPIGRRGLEGGHPTLWGGPLGTLPTPPLRL